jgi:hypothetical protein
MEWKTALIPPEFTSPPKPALEAWKAKAGDGREVQYLLWGEGTQAAPYQLFVRVAVLERPDITTPGKSVTDFRQPFMEEIQSAINHAAPPGAVFNLGQYISQDPKTVEAAELDPLALWIGHAVVQIGAVPLTSADLGGGIITGGNHHAH